MKELRPQCCCRAVFLYLLAGCMIQNNVHAFHQRVLEPMRVGHIPTVAIKDEELANTAVQSVHEEATLINNAGSSCS